MTRTLMAVLAASTLMVSAAASAAPLVVSQATQGAGEQPSRSADNGDEGRSGSTWIVAVLAALAVVGGIVAAASGDSQPESP